MLSIKNLSQSYGRREIFADLSFSVGRGQKAALVGKNGIGKSTLLRLIAGIEIPESGSILLSPKYAQVGYLPQEIHPCGDETVEAYIKRVSGVHDLDEFQVDGFFRGIGLTNIPLTHTFTTLSGGQRSKVHLVSLFIMNPDLLLLDEPTNNLDLTGILWLETSLKRSNITTLIVSHDRRFLDEIVDRVFEIDEINKSIITHACGYTEYLAQRARLFAHQKQLYREQQEEIARLSERVQIQKNWASKGAQQASSDNAKIITRRRQERAGGVAKRAGAIERRLDQMEYIEKPFEREQLIIPLDPLPISGDTAIELKDAQFSYPGDIFSFGPVTLSVPYGERIAIIGQNGTGKTTLLKIIKGTLQPSAGIVTLGKKLIIGDLSQSHDSLPLEQNTLEYLTDITREKQVAHYFLKKFGLDDESACRPLSSLSPGMRARLVLATFAYKKVNVLILDEPTNHLDIEALEAIEGVLVNYPGTVIAVTHDRWFLESLQPNHLILIEKGSIKNIEHFEDYLAGLTKTIRNTQKMT